VPAAWLPAAAVASSSPAIGMTRQDARRMIIRRAKKAGLLTRLGCHSFRATGITGLSAQRWPPRVRPADGGA